MIFETCPSETANERLSRFEEELLAAGPIGWKERPDVMRWLLEASFGVENWETKGTTCALFQGGCMIACGLQEPRKRPKVTGVTTWLKVSWFSGDEWIPAARLEQGEDILRGDIAYWCGGNANTWQSATNGHVGLVREGSGFTWTTAEGGGSNGRCKLSDAPKVILTHNQRPLRGVWRPDLMDSVRVDREHVTHPDGFLELRRGMHGPRVGQWQTELLRLGFKLPMFGADSDFGSETENATRAFQITHHIPNTGIVDRQSWDTARATKEQ